MLIYSETDINSSQEVKKMNIWIKYNDIILFMKIVRYIWEKADTNSKNEKM